jgi:hypothetical protein
VTVNDAPARYERSGAYVSLEGLCAGDVASVRHPLPLCSHTYVLGDDTFLVNFKGDTVLSITPTGQYVPLYQRDHYLQNDPPAAEQMWHLPDSEITP